MKYRPVRECYSVESLTYYYIIPALLTSNADLVVCINVSYCNKVSISLKLKHGTVIATHVGDL